MVSNKFRAGIFKQSMGARNRVGTGLSYRPTRLHSLESIPAGSINVKIWALDEGAGGESEGENKRGVGLGGWAVRGGE